MKWVIYTDDVQQTNVREPMPFPKKVGGEENFGHNQYILIKMFRLNKLHIAYWLIHLLVSP